MLVAPVWHQTYASQALASLLHQRLLFSGESSGRATKHVALCCCAAVEPCMCILFKYHQKKKTATNAFTLLPGCACEWTSTAELPFSSCKTALGYVQYAFPFPGTRLEQYERRQTQLCGSALSKLRRQCCRPRRRAYSRLLVSPHYISTVLLSNIYEHLLRGTIVNRIKYCREKRGKYIGFSVYRRSY